MSSSSSSSSSEEELSRVRSITSAFLVELGSVEWETTEDWRNGAKAKRQGFIQGFVLLSTNPIESQSPAPSGGPPWDLISKTLFTVVNRARQIIFSLLKDQNQQCAVTQYFPTLSLALSPKSKSFVTTHIYRCWSYN